MRRTGLRNLLAIITLTGILFSPAISDARFFYDNPFPDIDWLVLETDHFMIYYYPEVEWTAKMMAKYAEIAYPKITGLFDYPLKEKIHIVVRDQEDYSNGWAAYNFDQVTAWATPLYYVLRGRQEWIPDMFTHEFAHIVSLKANSWKSEGAIVVVGQGLVEDGVHNIDFGAAVVIGWNTPFFWAEGIAEYGTHLAGFNWWTSSRDMHQRMSMLEDNYLEYDQMFSRSTMGTSFDGERGYQQGYSMGLYVMEKFGKEKWAQLAINSGSEGHLMWEKNFDDVLGVDGPTLFAGWLKWMKDRYERQVAPIRKEEHVGFPLGPDTSSGYFDVVEKLPDGRWKVELSSQKCIPREYEERENLEKIAILLYNDPEKTDELAKLSPQEKQDLIAKAVKDDKDKKKKFDEKFEKIDENYSFAPPKIKYWNRAQRKSAMEAGGQFLMYPKFSPDGKYTAYTTRRTLVLSPQSIEEQPQFSGYCISKDRSEKLAEEKKTIKGASSYFGYSFSPDSKKIVFSSLGCPDTWLPCMNLDGYFRLDLFEYDIETEEIERVSRRLRAFMPSYSPDGQTVAFLHVEDGQNHLGVFPAKAREVTPDGKCVIDGQEMDNCVKWLIKKYDGTLLGMPSWSPDGSKIVVDLYRNHQQDIWIINADGSGLKPLTWDRAEDRDGQFTPDGKHIYYTSDRSGIFNLYRLNIESGEVKQLTNVIGGVYTPHLAANGDMLYAYFTSYGLRIYGHKKEDFYNKTIEAGYDVTAEEVARNLAYEEPLPKIKEASESYNPFSPRNWAPPIGIPLFIYESRGIQVGGQALLIDSLDKHIIFATCLMGQQSVYGMSYTNNFWYPSFFIGWTHLETSYVFAQGFNTSEQAGSRSDPHFPPPVNYKNRQSADFGYAGVNYTLAGQFGIGMTYVYRHLTSKRSSGTKEQAFLTNNSYSVALNYNGVSRRGPEADINPRGGRKLNVDYAFIRTGLPSKDWADVEWLGRSNPPGDNSDDYHSHELQFGYTEYIPISWWNPQGKHTLELHVRGGWVNRNVHRWDEFFAGSLHPLRYVPTHSTTHEFAGYEDYSLRGETMIILGVSYRFPIMRNIDKKIGPFYFVSLWAEISGTMGNMWGYTAEYGRDAYNNIDRHDESYWDPKVIPGTIRREIPFKDIASKNGNYLLYDIGFTVKLKALMFGTASWNSFVRIAYGLNDVIGQYEVNDDLAFVDAYPNNAMYAEIEPKSMRLSIGIGSDFD
jgi:WD40 repeat protein